MLRRGFSSAAGLLKSDLVNARVLNVVKSIRCVPPSVGATQPFSELGFDSLIKKDLWDKLENEFCVEVAENDVAKFNTVEDVTKYFAAHPKAR